MSYSKDTVQLKSYLLQSQSNNLKSKLVQFTQLKLIFDTITPSEEGRGVGAGKKTSF